MIVTGDLVTAYVMEKVGGRLTVNETSRNMGLVKDQRIVAGVVFNFSSYSLGGSIDDVEVTIAAERGAITRYFLREIGKYIRDQVGLFRVSITTTQPRIVRMAKQLGAVEEGRREIRPSEFATLLGITRNNWKF